MSAQKGQDSVSVGRSGVTVVPAAGTEAAADFSVTECPGGPLLVRGEFEVQDADGAAIPKNRETVALCRCSGSRIKPWCDGTHKLLKGASEN